MIYRLLMCANPTSYEIAHLAAAKLIPLKDVTDRSKEIDPTPETVIHRKGGVRSAKAIEAPSSGRYMASF